MIGGCARTGTTLLLSILSAHPAIYAIPKETFLLCPGAYPNGNLDEEQPMPDLCHPPNLKALNDLLANSIIPTTAHRWAEKTPRNALCFQAIHDAIPTARMIYMVRDGRDVVTSRHPRQPYRYWVTPEWWVAETNAGLAYPDALTIRYEDLVFHYERTVRIILLFIGELWHPNLDDYPDTATVRGSVNWFSGASPVHTKSLGRWRYPEHRQQVLKLERTPGAVELLHKLGYPAP